jgi:hypothetical protein
MKAKIPLLVGGAVGYVLGTRAGRERYEQIRSQAQTLWNNPKVQETAQKSAWAAQDFAKDKAPILKDKVADAAPGGGSGSGPSSASYSTADPVAATSATGMSATDPLAGSSDPLEDPDPLATSLDPDPLATSLDPDPLDTGGGTVDASTDPLSSTPDDRAPFPSSGSGL